MKLVELLKEVEHRPTQGAWAGVDVCDIVCDSRAARAGTAGRLAVVLGCAGERDPGNRPLMGRGALVVRTKRGYPSVGPSANAPRLARMWPPSGAFPPS